MIKISVVVNHKEYHDDNHEDDDNEYDSYSTLISTVEEPTFTISKSNDNISYQLCRYGKQNFFFEPILKCNGRFRLNPF